MKVTDHDEGEETQSPGLNNASWPVHWVDESRTQMQDLSAPGEPRESSLLGCWVSAIAMSKALHNASPFSGKGLVLGMPFNRNKLGGDGERAVSRARRDAGLPSWHACSKWGNANSIDHSSCCAHAYAAATLVLFTWPVTLRLGIIRRLSVFYFALSHNLYSLCRPQ